MAQVSLTTIIEAIEKGTFDAGIDRLTDAVYGRRIILKEKREQAIWDQLEVGTKIRLNNKVKPTYLRGLTGVVTDFRRTRVTLRMDNPLPGRYGTGKGQINRTLVCPPSLLQIVEPSKPPVDPSDLHIVEVKKFPSGETIWSREDDPDEILLKDALNAPGNTSAQYGPKPTLQEHLNNTLGKAIGDFINEADRS